MSRATLADEIVSKLLALLRHQHRVHHRLKREFGVSGRWLSVLHYLAAQGPHSVGEISRYLDLRDATTSSLLERMEREGLLQRERSSADNRRVVVSITERGRALAQHAPLTMITRLRRELLNLPESELAEFNRALHRIMELAGVETDSQEKE